MLNHNPSLQHKYDRSGLLYCLRLLSGSLSGCLALTFVYPMDVIRRRMQTGQAYKGAWDGLVAIARNEGMVRGLYRGLTLNYAKTVPNVGSIDFSALTSPVFSHAGSDLGGYHVDDVRHCKEISTLLTHRHVTKMYEGNPACVASMPGRARSVLVNAEFLHQDGV